MAIARRLTAGLILAALVVGAGSAVASPVSAQAALPYVAYGVGLQRGQVVEAFARGTSVGRVTADRSGRWKMTIEPGAVSNGDQVSFTVDGADTGKTVEFQAGRFPAPPGIALAAAGAAASATATPKATASPRPSATSKPKAACTKNGRPVVCASASIGPIAGRP